MDIPLKVLISAPFLCVLLLLEAAVPAVAGRAGRRRHALRHCAVAAINFLPLVAITATLTAVVLAATATGSWGLLNRLPLPGLAATVAAILILDLWMYVWHRLNHRIDFLWRFHRMHHTDTALDCTSAFRFHTVEMTLSALLRLLIIPVVGLSLWHLAMYEAILLPVIMLHHSNLKLPSWLDAVLNIFIVTPAIHHVHHSRQRHETDSNYASVFSFWDRIFASFSRRAVSNPVDYGLQGWDGDQHQSVRGMLASSFADDPGPVDRDR